MISFSNTLFHKLNLNFTCNICTITNQNVLFFYSKFKYLYEKKKKNYTIILIYYSISLV
jgi:hypothetical protein